MFTLVVAQRLGFESELTLWLSVLEGVCLTIALMLLVERYLFSARDGAGISLAPKAGAMRVAAAAAESGSAPPAGAQS